MSETKFTTMQSDFLECDLPQINVYDYTQDEQIVILEPSSDCPVCSAKCSVEAYVENCRCHQCAPCNACVYAPGKCSECGEVFEDWEYHPAVKQSLTVADRMAALIEKHKNALPKWARWIAVDENGDSYAFKETPYQGVKQWRSIPSQHIHFVSDASGDLRYHWRETLTEIKPVANEQDHGTIDNMADVINRQQAKALAAFNKDIIGRSDPEPTLTIPSICLRDPVMPMMLGGQFGALSNE